MLFTLQSPDMNIIENLWVVRKHAVYATLEIAHVKISHTLKILKE